MNFIILVHNWEMDAVSSLFNALYSIRLGRGMKISSVEFLRKDDYLRSTFYIIFLPSIDFSFPHKNILRSKVPLRVAFFNWTAFLVWIIFVSVTS
jgi:hypothetical protein